MGRPILVWFESLGSMKHGSTELDVYNNGWGGEVSPLHTFGDARLYLNRLDQARLQLARVPRQLPEMRINPAVTDIFAFCFGDFALEGYDPYPHIRAKVTV